MSERDAREKSPRSPPPEPGAAQETGTGSGRAGDSDRTGSHEGRREVISRLFNEHNQSLLRFLVTKLSSEQEARDVAQEAYVRMLNLDTPEVVSHSRAYLFKIAANLAIDRLRSRAVENRVFEFDFFEDLPRECDPARGLAAAEQVEFLGRCIRELPAKCRQAFLLRRLEGMSSTEISRVLQVPERTVRHYIVEAILYCQRRLTAEVEKGTIGNGAGHGP